ncbi:protein of unknown function [Candidatus Hydrogenisulfobacillus filiaventi]|uniref:Uncharacterized protein n=1 Tax=Candidatus Hydrogenisulfobacillus filiaventi TaxID=2707344 RepID=A0A6F8ZHG1_9FIRM|nr:protein of unknown function [Candidatus Hydrogenisulfobacillus filiaventi]
MSVLTGSASPVYYLGKFLQDLTPDPFRQ